MQIDRNALQKLLSLNDKQLETVVRKLATDYGLDLSTLNINTSNLKNLRTALQNATDEDLKTIGEQFKNGRGKK